MVALKKSKSVTYLHPISQIKCKKAKLTFILQEVPLCKGQGRDLVYIRAILATFNSRTLKLSTRPGGGVQVLALPRGT